MINVVVLAAGLGKRMHSDLPKVLQPLAGKPMLSHVLETIKKLADVKKTVVVVGHKAETVKAMYAGDASVEFVLQEPQMGTGHALQCALPALDSQAEGTLVLLGDVPLVQPETIARLMEVAGDGMAILTTVLRNPTGYGRILRQRGRIVAIVEQKDATEGQKQIREVNTGIMLLPTARLAGWLSELKASNAQGEYYLTDVIGLAVRDGVRINSARPRRSFEVEGVNSKTQLARLEGIWQDHQAEMLTDQGVTILDPSRLDIRGKLVCGKDVTIDVGVIFEGDVTLGDGVKVGPYCVIRNAVIGAGTVIDAFSHIDSATVGNNAKIGPYARLRPGAELADTVHIGNFVEIKKSVIGTASKVNHLSYIGDTDMGARVNVGAGTITCNYDGVNKFRTTIGDDVFIGSDTQLVAPVTVGDGATLGAGTTLTKNAPEGKLTISRVRQMTIDAWQRPQKDE
ncbi:MAG: bifunctional UDP-N-acetylglucosamine diphosphorylase/glucosamine-1-phosphate N-acetyltransferase GlmU [Sutterellaceae bacterium]|nr:bifunctional UDP-N-acetylglucosamine diphosphorylase/glucosamine-1-phosphate N-acetyltransferase GlmU [Sutterellaceae bacterium]